MKLSVGEKIQILRSRKKASKGDLGELIFNKQLKQKLTAANIKMRKIETGLQNPTNEELEAFAKFFGVDISFFISDNEANDQENFDTGLFDLFPSLREKLELMNPLIKRAKQGGDMYRDMIVTEFADFLKAENKRK